MRVSAAELAQTKEIRQQMLTSGGVIAEFNCSD